MTVSNKTRSTLRRALCDRTAADEIVTNADDATPDDLSDRTKLKLKLALSNQAAYNQFVTAIEADNAQTVGSTAARQLRACCGVNAANDIIAGIAGR